MNFRKVNADSILNHTMARLGKNQIGKLDVGSRQERAPTLWLKPNTTLLIGQYRMINGTTSVVPSAELLYDGSFETTKLPLFSWMNFYSSLGSWFSNGSIELWKSGYNLKYASNGSQFIELDSGTTPNNSIWQSVQTQAGKQYSLSFDFSMRSGYSTASNTFQVLWNGKVIKTIQPGSTNWSKLNLLVTGTGGLDKLEFREMSGDTDSGGTFLDNISLKEFTTSSGSGFNPAAESLIQLTAEDTAFLFSKVNQPSEIRDVGGFGNNLAHPSWGTAGSAFVRLSPASYGDTGSNPHGVVNGVQTLPNERLISNVISNQDENKDGIEEVQNNTFGTNLFLMSFGQFFDHGLDFIKRGTEKYSFTTETGSTITITRGEQDANGNHINMTSPYVDQNQTYGSDDSITYYLRKSIGIDQNGNGIITGKSAKLLSGGPDGSGEESLPTYREVLLNNGVSKAVIDAAIAANDFSILAADADFIDFRNVKDPLTGQLTGHALLLDIAANANPALAGVPGIKFNLELLLNHYVGGDGRVNENIALTPIHTIFHREHDFQVEKLRALNPTWTENQLFEAAKIIVEAEYQRVVFDEFADALAGGIPGKGNHGFGGYDPSVNATISEEFANAIYRVGHSMINETIPFADASGKIHEMSLVDAFLNPAAFKAIGVDALIEGSVNVLHQQIDENLVNAVRNQLLGVSINDLAAINIARGRETGLPSLNELRKYLYENGLALGDQASDLGMTAKGNSALKPYTGWDDFAAHLRDPSLVELFKKVYGSNDADVNKVDIWIGGLAEKPEAGQLGSTFGFIFREQLDRLQDGDRFYYKERLDDTQLLDDIEAQTFSDIIMRNSGLKYLHDDIFKAAKTEFMSSNAYSKYGSSAHEVLVGNAFANLISGGDGDDTNYGEDGNDTLYGNSGNDGLRGGNGDDKLYGGIGDDRLVGGLGNDIGYGEDGDDQAFGDEGNDVFYGQLGNDELLGGSGDDKLVGSYGDDRLVGSDGTDTLYGDSGFDKLQGGNGNDSLSGGSEDDDLNGGAGNDTLDGGSGSDTASFESAASSVSVNLIANMATGLLTGSDKLVSIENVEGGNFADTIQGNAFNNLLEGGLGNDLILGDAGNDTVVGEGGYDSMDGGAGNDLFVFESVLDIGLNGVTDVITGFVIGQDKIDLSAIDANVNIAGDQGFTYIGKGFMNSTPGQLRIVQYDNAGTANDYTQLRGDFNGDKAADFSLKLMGLINLTAADLIL